MSKPIQEGLFTWPSDQPELLGSYCKKCDEYYFPVKDSSACCPEPDDLETVPLGSSGTLWSWTIQGFMPKAPYKTDETPETFMPYGVGYVELPCGLKVESRLRAKGNEGFKIGMQMRLAIEPFRGIGGANEELHFLFEAVE